MRQITSSTLALSLFALVVVCLSIAIPTKAFAAIESREILKTYFETGDVPTQEQFGSLIDSLIHFSEDRQLLGLRTAADGGAALITAGEILDFSQPFAPAAGLSNDWIGQTGFLGIAYLENSLQHLGLLQVRASAPGSPDPYPMEVQYFIYDNQPASSLTAQYVPEPSSFTMAAVGGVLLLWRIAARLTRRFSRD